MVMHFQKVEHTILISLKGSSRTGDDRQRCLFQR